MDHSDTNMVVYMYAWVFDKHSEREVAHSDLKTSLFLPFLLLIESVLRDVHDVHSVHPADFTDI